MNEWIKCSDRLPELIKDQNYSEDVLCICVSHGENNEFGFPNTYSKGEKYLCIDSLIVWQDKEKPSFRSDRYYGKATYWMPIPELPKD